MSRASLQSFDLAFRLIFFSAFGCFWKQIRGAGIGSQISPSLSNLAVTVF